MSQGSPQVGAGNITFQGNTSTPANCIVSTTSEACFTISGSGTKCIINGFELRTTTVGDGISVSDAGFVNVLSNMRFGTCATRHISTARCGIVFVATGYDIVGGASAHFHSIQNGIIFSNNDTFTITGTPAFTFFCDIGQGSSVRLTGATFTGSATGMRYNVESNGILNVGGAGASYLPGHAGGATSTGGQYL